MKAIMLSILIMSLTLVGASSAVMQNATLTLPFSISNSVLTTLVTNNLMTGSTYCKGVGEAYSPNFYKYVLVMPANGQCALPSVARFESSTPNTPILLDSFSFKGTFNGIANSLASQNDAFDIFATNSFNFHGKEFGFITKITDGAMLGYMQSNDVDFHYVVLHPATTNFNYSGKFTAQLVYNGIDNVNFYQNGKFLGTVSDTSSAKENYTTLRYWMYINAARYSNGWTSSNSIDYAIISNVTAVKHRHR